MRRSRSDRASVREAVLLWALLMVAVAQQMLRFAIHGESVIEVPVLYQAGTIAFNYFDFGAVRRGLGGSIAYLLASDLRLGALRFHLLFAALAAALTCALYRRIAASTATRIGYAATLVTLFARWGDDVARTDMAIVTCIALAVFALLRRRMALAMAAVGVGLFIHESSFIFGLPMLAAMVWRLGGPRAFAKADLWTTAALFVLAIVVYVGMTWLPHADRQTMVDVVRSKLPLHKHVDWAIYFALSGFRGVVASMCQNAVDPSYWTHPMGGLLAMAAAYLACSWRVRREVPAVLLAALPGFAMLCYVANDIARWTMFACANIWLLQATTGRRDGVPDVRPALAAFCGLALVFAVNPPQRFGIPYPIYAGATFFEQRVVRLGGRPTPSVEDALARCDPGWREVLGDPPFIDP